ncbi:MAG: potassium-transporting ATPase subunit KdpA [Kiritimatiellae bacterium]|nr:potassium-transporting ATPase subunit KdpA [Kiritimatiellia bacterium]
MIARTRFQRSFGAPSRLVVLAFAAAVAVGALLFALPFANADGAWHLDLKSLFLATSACCVTGLDPVGVGAALTPFGKAVLVVLVELGGLGIMTIGTFLFLAAGRSLSVDEERSVMNTLGASAPRQVGPVLWQTVVFTLWCEAAGALLLASRFGELDLGLGFGTALARGAFFSVMSFCNAGFSLFPDSFAPLLRDPCATFVSCALSFAGGIGFIVFANLSARRPWRRNRLERGRVSLHSRLVLEGVAAVVLLSLLVYPALEARGAYAGLSGGETFCAALFQAFSSRSSGFACVSVASYGPATLAFTMALMFVGAAPGSTGGGVKTTTVAVLFATVRAMFHSRDTPELHGRSVPRRAVGDAIAVTVLAGSAVALTTFALLLAETGGPARPGALVFEAVSAFANNGMEIDGTTASLSGPGLAVVSAAMFAGRLGPVALVLTLFRRRRADLSKRFPEENVIVG